MSVDFYPVVIYGIQLTETDIDLIKAKTKADDGPDNEAFWNQEIEIRPDEYMDSAVENVSEHLDHDSIGSAAYGEVSDSNYYVGVNMRNMKKLPSVETRATWVGAVRSFERYYGLSEHVIELHVGTKMG
jgi:hypothetical protein